ncbi:hypothetical protein V2J09_020680 [Rumex salicifolius]
MYSKLPDMHIEELSNEEGVFEVDDHCLNISVSKNGTIDVWDTKRVFVGAGARLLFYPTLFYNIVRNKFQSEFRWWDRVDEFILLGAVPFPTDVLRLKELGVGGVVTLNEHYETLVPASLYHAHEIDHLVIPTRDYLFAPSMVDINQAVQFIHRNASCGRTTYVHCKAGRGRSTTVVLCYLVQYKQMNPEDAYNYVKAIRPRVHLAPSQWQAVQDFYHLKVKKGYTNLLNNLMFRTMNFPKESEFLAFDDCSAVLVTRSDLDGYDSSTESARMDASTICKVRTVGEAALTRISCLWLRSHHTQQKNAGVQLRRDKSCAIEADQITGVTVDIHKAGGHKMLQTSQIIYKIPQKLHIYIHR